MGEELKGHVLQLLGEPVGGIRRHVHSIIFGLRGRPGLKQSYACAAASGDAGFKRDLPVLKEALEGRLLELNIVKKPSPSDVCNLIRLARYVRKERVSIVHGHGAKGGAYARMLAALCGVKAVYTPHGGSVHDMFGWLEGGIYTLAEKALLPLTNNFVFESRYSAQAYFKKVGRQPSNWIVNYNGIAPVLENAAAKPFPVAGGLVNVGVFGMLRAQKGQIYAVRAAQEIARAYKNILLHIYGMGPDRDLLAEEAKRLGIAQKVILHGETDAPLERMKEMDVILIPSLFESFGYVAIEAFSLRRPIVASSAGGLPEIIADGIDGLLVPPGSPEKAAAAVIKLIGDPVMAEKMGGAGYRKLVDEFSVDRMLANLARIYSEASGSGWS